MTESGFRKLWFAGVALVAAAIVVASLLPLPMPAGEPGADKLYHFVAYLLLALLASGIVTPERLPRAMLQCFLLGAAVEALQGAITEDRIAEWADLLANGAGILSAWAIAAGGRAGWGPRIAARLIGDR